MEPSPGSSLRLGSRVGKAMGACRTLELWTLPSLHMSTRFGCTGFGFDSPARGWALREVLTP